VPLGSWRKFGCALALISIVAGTGCGRLFDAEGQLAGSIADVAKCGSYLNATSSRPLPRALPIPRRTHSYQYLVEGSTQFWSTTVPGSSSTLVDVRNRIKQGLNRAGYIEIAQDQELGAEADYYFAGRYIGSVQVRPLCDGRLRVRYGFGAESLGSPHPPGKGSPLLPLHKSTTPPTTVPPPTAVSNCAAVPPPLSQPLPWIPTGLSLPTGSYASADLSKSAGSLHAASFVVPGDVADFFNYVANAWPNQGVTITFGEQDPNDSEFVFQYGGNQGSMALTRPFCDSEFSSLVLAYGSS
jgi:hypothetical protein